MAIEAVAAAAVATVDNNCSADEDEDPGGDDSLTAAATVTATAAAADTYIRQSIEKTYITLLKAFVVMIQVIINNESLFLIHISIE